MASNYPTSLDGTTQLPRPAGTNLLADANYDHAADHTTISQAVIAVETKLGLNAGSAANNQLLIGVGAGSSTWGTVWTGGSIVNPNISGGTHNNGVFGSPTLQQGTLLEPFIDTHSIGSAAYQGTNSSTTTLDLGTAQRLLVNLPATAGSITLAVSNVVSNRPFIVELLQGTSGLGTVNWFTTIRWAGSVAPSQTFLPSRKDTFGFMPTSTSTFDGYIVGINL